MLPFECYWISRLSTRAIRSASSAVIHKAALPASIVVVNALLTMTIMANDTEQKQSNVALILCSRRPCHDFTPRRSTAGRCVATERVEIGALLNVRPSSHKLRAAGAMGEWLMPLARLPLLHEWVRQRRRLPRLVAGPRIPVVLITCCKARARKKYRTRRHALRSYRCMADGQ